MRPTSELSATIFKDNEGKKRKEEGGGSKENKNEHPILKYSQDMLDLGSRAPFLSLHDRVSVVQIHVHS